jgi:hypothetical protein
MEQSKAHKRKRWTNWLVGSSACALLSLPYKLFFIGKFAI